MNRVAKFFHELFKPHCQHCVDERREQREEQRFCASCESLAHENDRLVRDNERLLSLLLAKPETPAEKVTSVQDLKPINTSRTPFIPSVVRRQTLEAESRVNARLQRDAVKPDATIDKDKELAALEQELNDVRTKREAATS